MELKQKIISSLSNWSSMSDIVSAVGGDRDTIKSTINEMRANNEILVVGKGRGTKYAKIGTPTEKTRDLKTEILNLLQSDSKSRKDLCEELSTKDDIVYDIQVKNILELLIKEGLVSSNNKKRGQKFWLSENETPEDENNEPFEKQVLDELSLGKRTIKMLNEKLGSYATKTKNCLEELVSKGLVQTNGAKRSTIYWLMGKDSVDDCSTDSSKPKIDNFDDLLKEGITYIPQGVPHDQSEVLKIICESSEHSLSQWYVAEELSKAITDGRHGLLWRFEFDMNNGGNRVKVYTGFMPNL